jgi:hypothetical protein
MKWHSEQVRLDIVQYSEVLVNKDLDGGIVGVTSAYGLSGSENIKDCDLIIGNSIAIFLLHNLAVN